MAGRYPFWHRRAGAVDAPPALRNLGKKLLEELANRQRLGAPRTLVLREKTPDGTVEARMVWGKPQVFFRLNPVPAGEQPRPYLDGFVVSPAEELGTEWNEVVLQPVAGDSWHVFFFSEDQVPVDYPTGAGIYSKAFGKPFLDEPDGLQNVGNVDWRNADETLCVSWVGPASRYLGDTYVRDTKVFYKGAVLFDIADYAEFVFEEVWSVQVSGACLVRSGGLKLIVALRRQATGSFISQYDDFILVPLRIPVGAPMPAGGIQLAPRLEPAVDEEGEGIVLLGSRFADVGTVEDAQHPWMFNQSGTEARCIRPEHGTAVHELIATLSEELDEVEFTVESDAWPLTTITTADEAIYSPAFMTGTDQWMDSLSPSPGSFNVAWVQNRTMTSGFPFVQEAELDWVVERHTVTQRVSPLLKVAVDFRDDEPVYAHYRGPNDTQSSDFTSTRAGTWTGTIESYTLGPVDGSGNPTLTAWSTQTLSAEESSSLYVQSRTGSLASLETDWMTVVAGHGVDGTPSARTQTRTASKSHEASASDAGSWSGWNLTSLMNSNANRTVAVDYSIADSDAVLTSQLGINYLDLRYKWIVYTLQTDGAFLTEAGSWHEEGTTIGGETIGTGADGSPPGGGSTLLLGDVGATLVPGSHPMTTVVGTQWDTSESRQLVTCNGHTLVDEVTSTFNPVATNYTPEMDDWVLTSNSLLTLLARGTERFAGRTREAKFALGGSSLRTVDTPGGSTSDVFWLYGSALDDGSWQTYKGKYAYSMRVPVPGDDPALFHGIGRVSTGAPSSFTLPQMTGFAGDPQLFTPISILTPTAPR